MRRRNQRTVSKRYLRRCMAGVYCVVALAGRWSNQVLTTLNWVIATFMFMQEEIGFIEFLVSL
jgi:hypothetical protein